jgi:hypothetical protein
MKNLLIYALSAVLVITSVIGFFNDRQNDKEIDMWKGNYETVNSNFQTYKTETDGTLVTYQNTINLKKRELKAALESDSVSKALAEKYRRASQAVKIETKYVESEPDTVEVEKLIPVLIDTSFTYKNECIGIDFGTYDGQLIINGIMFDNNINIVSGARKVGLFKTEQAIDVTHSNPCIETTGLTHYNIVIEKKWWENPLITIPAGFAVGYLTNEAVDVIGNLNE